jgi:hypothetical protein
MRLAYFRADDTERQDCLWEEKLSPLTHDPRQTEIERLEFQIGSKREEITCLQREVRSRTERIALLRKDIKAQPFQSENVAV